MLGRLKFELDELANEMLDQLPEELFRSKTTTFLDPCMGGGQFVKAVEARLRHNGHSDENIARRVFGVESSELRVNYAVNKYGLVGQYFVHEDYLEYDEEMKFDVVIGNPPYQEGKNKNLYQEFVTKSLSLGTYVMMITPAGWMSVASTSSTFKSILTPSLMKYKALGGNAFGGVQLMTCYFLCNMNNLSLTVTIEALDGTGITVSKDSLMYFPCSSIRTLSIIDKVLSMAENNNLVGKKGSLNRNQATKKNDIRCIFSAGFAGKDYDWCWISKNHQLKGDVVGIGAHKVVLSRQTAIGKLGEVKYAGPEYAVAQGCYMIEVSSKTEGKNLINYLNSKIVKLVITETKASVVTNSQALFKLIPKIDLSRIWTDEELYEHFGLTQEEIDYIEATVK